MKTHQTTFSLTHKGITITASIDYDKGTASLVNPRDYFKPMKWIYANREATYMQGWIDVMEAQIVMVKECERLLKEDSEVKSRMIAELIVASTV